MAIAFVAASSTQTSSATATLSVPSGTQADDVLIALLWARGDNSQTITPPAGWTAVTALLRTGNNTATDANHQVFVRVAGGSEPGSYTWTLGSSMQWSGGMVAYRGVDTAAPIDNSSTQIVATSATITAPSLTTLTNGAQLVYAIGVNSGSTSITAPSGYSERFQVTTNLRSAVADHAQATAGASGTVAATLSASRSAIAVLFALRPAGAERTASLTQTQAAQGLSSGAAAAIAAAVTQTQASQALTSQAIAALAADLATSQDPQALTSQAAAASVASLTRSQDAQALTSQAAVAIAAAVSISQAPQVLSSGATAARAATVIVSQDAQTLNSGATAALAAGLTQPQASQTLSSGATAARAASLTRSQDAQVLSGQATAALAAGLARSQDAQTLHALASRAGDAPLALDPDLLVIARRALAVTPERLATIAVTRAYTVVR